MPTRPGAAKLCGLSVPALIRWTLLTMMLCFGSFVATAQARPPNAAGLADGCTSRHGVNGSSVGGIPSIAGHDRAVLESQLQDFRAQKGDATIMNRIIRGYSDAEINALADYFSSTSKP